MNYRIFLIACLLSLLLLSWQPVHAADMRGFGAVQATALPDGAGMKFACDSPAHAVLLIHKLAHDMAQSATVPSHWTTVQIGGQAVPVLVRPGLGAYLVLAQGSDAYCFTAPLTAGRRKTVWPRPLPPPRRCCRARSFTTAPTCIRSIWINGRTRASGPGTRLMTRLTMTRRG